MASFPAHVTVSAALGCAVGVYGSWQLNYDWGPVFLAAVLTTIGGMLPDLDSDSGIPVREMFGTTTSKSRTGPNATSQVCRI